MGLGVATNILRTLETSSSIGMFARDTGGCLISRLGLSRSKDESREISIAELSESAMFYFSAPILAKATANIFSKTYNINKDQFTSPIKDLKNSIDTNTLKKIKLAKFGQIAMVFGLILPAVFAIAPIRNMVTLSKSGKNQFTSVVGLENIKNEEQRKEAKDKSINLFKKLGIVSTATMGAAFGILALSKNKNFYKATEPIIDKVVKHLDFTKSGDLKLMHYGALIYPVSIASYFYASRDKYEVMENIRRFSITVPLLFWGEKLIQNPIHKFFDKKFGTNVMDKNGIKSYKDILKMPLEQRNKHLKTKNWAYGLTFFINTMAIAAAVAGLNRFETKRNFEKDNNSQVSKNSK